MATLQKIRSKGKFLIAVVGLALFAFIAEEFVRSLSYSQSESRQRIGKVNGESINIQEFNDEVDEYVNVVKFSNGITSLTDDQMSMLRDQVWQTMVNNKIIEHEAEKLGLTVTDAELQDIIAKGSNPMLAQTPFRTQQGTFDANALKQFLTQYDEIMRSADIPGETKEQYANMYDYWKFVEKSIRQQTLLQKYQSLLSGALLSNPVAAQDHFDGRTNEADIVMAAVPYSSIKDDEIQVEDKDIKAKYEEMKEIFRTQAESRDIRYIDVKVEASKADKDALQTEMQAYAGELQAEGANPAKIVREAGSKVSFSPLPVSKKSLPSDIAAEIDSLGEGQQKGPFLTASDNTLNIVRLISKVTLPDSVEIRQIAVPGTDVADAEKRADSIISVLQAGTAFDSIAKKFDQPAAKNWITSAQYENQTIDENNRIFLQTITTAATGAINKIVLPGQGVLVNQVTDRRNMVEKYNLAIIKRAIDFSKDTYGKAYSDIKSFLVANKTLEQIETEAPKAGFNVQSRKGMSSAEHGVVGIHGTSEALRWVFNEDTKVGDVSPLYECGDNDHLLVAVLTGIHPKGYLSWDDEQVKTFLTDEVKKDKKAALIQEQMQGVKDMAAAAKLKGAVSDTIKHVTFASNTFVSKLGSSEPALSGAVSAAKKGDFKQGIKGKNGVYAFQVISTNKTGAKYDQKQEEQQLAQTNMRSLNLFTSELYQKADVVDKRYLFY